MFGESSTSNQKDDSSSSESKEVEINIYNQAVGDEAGRFKTDLGKLVRAHIPITYNDWRVVPETYKEDVWNDIQASYKVPQTFKTDCYKLMGSQLKSCKSMLRKEHYDKYKSDAERLAIVPPNVKPEQWKEFVEIEGTTEAKRRREAGKLNRSKCVATHTCGRQGQAQVEHKLKKQKANVGRTEVWISAHTKSDGTIPASFTEKMDLVVAKDKELQDSGNYAKYQSLTCDALAQVFGIDKRGRTRGIGSRVSRSSIEASMPALALLETEKVASKEVNTRLDKLETNMGDVKNKLSDLVTILSSKNSKSQYVPIVEGIANHGESSSRGISQDDGISCEIKGFSGKVIAKGRIDATPREKVHGYTVDYEEEVVIIVDTILDPNASLYMERQGAAENLGEIGNGSWVVWPKGLVKRIL